MDHDKSHEHIFNKPFILPPDVLLFPVTDLADHILEKIDYNKGDYAITRPYFRTYSRIVDKQTALFLQEFRNPSLIIDVIIKYSRKIKYDPNKFLEDIFPILLKFSESMILVPADSPLAKGVKASFGVGQVFAGFEIRRLIQTTEDSEIYQAKASNGKNLALKISKKNPSGSIQTAFKREYTALNLLHNGIAPPVLDHSVFNDHSYIAIYWIDGVPINIRANEIRNLAINNWRQILFDLCKRLLASYHKLHLSGILHGDIHFRNILVDSQDQPFLLDFGLARFVNHHPELNDPRRSGMEWAMEPELAEALIKGEKAPPASFAGEQYAIASMIYYLICGKPYLESSTDKKEMYRRIVEEPPLQFTSQAFESWPDIEGVLTKALSKKPEDRYSSTENFLTAFTTVRAPAKTSNNVVKSKLMNAIKWKDHLIKRLSQDFSIKTFYPSPPYSSFYYGATGLTWFLYRLAQMDQNSQVLSIADIWSRQVKASISNDNALIAEQLGISPETVGPESIYHMSPGFHCIQSLLHHGQGDFNKANHEIDSFLKAVATKSQKLELSFGQSGVLLGGAHLLDIGFSEQLNIEPLYHFLKKEANNIWKKLSAKPEINKISNNPHLGIAHGWAGMVYAQLRIRQAMNVSIPGSLTDRLNQLADYGEPTGRGVSWIGTTIHQKHGNITPAHTPGWCSGSAGYVFLWVIAHKLLQNPRYLELAEKAAWYTWEYPDQEAQLCCGLAGRVFALLHFYKYTGELAWLKKAQSLSYRISEKLNHFEDQNDHTFSLFRGSLGAVLVCLEIEFPEQSTMPLFEPEGWPKFQFNTGHHLE